MFILVGQTVVFEFINIGSSRLEGEENWAELKI